MVEWKAGLTAVHWGLKSVAPKAAKMGCWTADNSAFYWAVHSAVTMAQQMVDTTAEQKAVGWDLLMADQKDKPTAACWEQRRAGSWGTPRAATKAA